MFVFLLLVALFSDASFASSPEWLSGLEYKELDGHFEPSVNLDDFGSEPDREKGLPAKKTDSLVVIHIDLGEQKARLIESGQVVYEAPISSGKPGDATPSGVFSVTEKKRFHRSNLYGSIRKKNGLVEKKFVDIRKVDLAGRVFEGAPMNYFLRINGAIGIHASNFVPDYPASNGCIRLRPVDAEVFYSRANIGTVVSIDK
jgi:lipoprotein-anchoring transpeptidase ErfK/SrfK